MLLNKHSFAGNEAAATNGTQHWRRTCWGGIRGTILDHLYKLVFAVNLESLQTQQLSCCSLAKTFGSELDCDMHLA